VKWILCLLLLLSPVANAKERSFHALAAFSTNFSFPGSIRIGWQSWELGQLTPFCYGFDKIFDLNEYTYSTFGFGYSTNIALYGGVGFNLSWHKLGIRGELTTTFDANGFTQGLGVLGASYGF
jgi:hypothetical protein